MTCAPAPSSFTAMLGFELLMAAKRRRSPVFRAGKNQISQPDRSAGRGPVVLVGTPDFHVSTSTGSIRGWSPRCRPDAAPRDVPMGQRFFT